MSDADRDDVGQIVADLLNPNDMRAAKLWAHLTRFCGFDSPHPLDPNALQRREGRREVMIELLRLAGRPTRIVKDESDGPS